MSKHPAWIIARGATGGKLAYAMECLRCGEIQEVATPISLNCYIALARAFEREHRGCIERSEAAKAAGKEN